MNADLIFVDCPQCWAFQISLGYFCQGLLGNEVGGLENEKFEKLSLAGGIKLENNETITLFVID